MKHLDLSRSAWLLGAMAIGLLVLALALSGAYVQAAGPATEAALSPAGDTEPAGADDNVLEVGVEWVNDYPGTGSDLSATDDDALGLYNRLGSCGWTRRFAYGNSLAWEEDWKGAAKPGGGTEDTYVDNVDLAYFSGHGSTNGFWFGVGGNTHDDAQLTYSDARLEWGEKDAEWIGLSTCLVLDDSHLRDWAWTMNGLHLILGFKTTMADTAHGVWFGQYLCQGYNFTQAWFMAADRSQPSGKIARVMAEESYHFYDRPGNHIGGDTWDMDYYYWDHHVGSEPARHVNIDQLGGSMPIFETPPLSLGEAQTKWGELGSAFGVPVTPAITLLSDDVWTSPDGQLQMDSASGLYAYTNQAELWAAPNTASLQGPMVQVRLDDVHGIADQFLASHGLLPGDAQFYEVVSDSTTTATLPGQGDDSTAGTILQTENTAWQAIYSRILSYTPPAGSGLAETVEFSVVGPGAKLKVYVPPEVPASQLAQGTSVIGGVGGWRSVSASGTQANATPQLVTMLTYEQIQKLFEQLEPTVALSYIPVVYESRDIVTHTVAYYEQPLGTGQNQLIPVYVLEVNYTLAGGQTTSSPAYIPVNPTYMAPLAKINPVSSIPGNVHVGQQLVFQAADASANLSTQGFDTSLNFPLGTGDPDSYLYTWYRNSVSSENVIGTGRTLNYLVTLASQDHPGAQTIPQSIILEVQDSLSTQPPSRSVATYNLTIVPSVYLPVMVSGY